MTWDRESLTAWLRRQVGNRHLGTLRRVWSEATNGHAPAPSPESLYVRLAMQLGLERLSGQPGKSLLLVSPSSERLIRETGLGLASVLARDLRQRVLVVEAGQAPPLAAGETAPKGMNDLLRDGPALLGRFVKPTSQEGLFVLPHGSGDPVPAARAAENRTAIVRDAVAGYDTLIVLGSPVLMDPRALAFAPIVDHALLVAFEARTYVTELDSSLNVLAERKAAGVAVVLAR